MKYYKINYVKETNSKIEFVSYCNLYFNNRLSSKLNKSEMKGIHVGDRSFDQKFVSTVNFYETYGMTSSWSLPRVGCICIARKRCGCAAKHRWLCTEYVINKYCVFTKFFPVSVHRRDITFKLPLFPTIIFHIAFKYKKISHEKWK